MPAFLCQIVGIWMFIFYCTIFFLANFLMNPTADITELIKKTNDDAKEFMDNKFLHLIVTWIIISSLFLSIILIIYIVVTKTCIFKRRRKKHNKNE